MSRYRMARMTCVLCGRVASARALEHGAGGLWRCKDGDNCHLRRKRARRKAEAAYRQEYP